MRAAADPYPLVSSIVLGGILKTRGRVSKGGLLRLLYSELDGGVEGQGRKEVSDQSRVFRRRLLHIDQ